MNLRKHLSYKGLDCSGEYKVLPPTFQGIRSLVERAGGNEDAVAAAFPPLDFVDDKEHSLVGEFVTELQNCDKVERIELVRQFDSYVKDLRESSKKPSGKDPEKDPEPPADPEPSAEPTTE